MRVYVEDDDGVELFVFDQAEHRFRSYPDDVPEATRVAITKALTDALRYILHLEQPE
jgi:hypothetical protein